MSEALNIIRETIKQKLLLCTEPQQAFFLRIYPKGIDSLDLNRAERALELIENTIIKNKKNLKNNKRKGRSKMSGKIKRPESHHIGAWGNRNDAGLSYVKKCDVDRYCDAVEARIAELETENKDLNERLDAVVQERCNATTEKLSELTRNLKAVSEQLSTPVPPEFFSGAPIIPTTVYGVGLTGLLDLICEYKKCHTKDPQSFGEITDWVKQLRSDVRKSRTSTESEAAK